MAAHIVNDVGLISIVHDPNLGINAKFSEDHHQSVYEAVNRDNINFFKANWGEEGQYPNTGNGCANNACDTIGNECLCSVEVDSVAVFTSMPTKKQIIANLKVGHAPPDWYDDGSFTLQREIDGVSLFVKSGEELFSSHTVFGIQYRGKLAYFRNVASTVKIAGNTGGVTYKFRNPPHMVNIAKPDTRDAIYETEAILDHYFYHSNTAPFLASRLIKRFGISNPSPRYVKAVAQAFSKGTYSSKRVVFGDGNYGNLEAMAASIVLDREATSVALDADPTTGSLREPLLKVMSFMRSMEYNREANITTVMLRKLQDKVGQDTLAPNVFSFFLPDFEPPGPLSDAGLSSPEAQVLDSPKTIGFLNGMYSMIDIGLSNCFGGFGDRNTWNCDLYTRFSKERMRSRGYFRFVPANSTNAQEVINELSLLLTGGRLNSVSKNYLVNAFNQELQATNNNEKKALRVVQKLFLATPGRSTSSAIWRIQI